MLNSQPQTLNKIPSKTFKILSIARPSKLIDLLKLELSNRGYKIELVHDAMSGLLRCRETKPQLVILDWHISVSVVDLCRRLHRDNFSIFVLDVNCCEGTNSLSHRVAALDAGADDCISFPFAMNEFLARIRVQLRKYEVYESSVLIFEDLRLDSSTREVYRGDRHIYLTTREFALLEYLLAHPRQVLTRSQIIERVWGYDYLGDSNIIEVYIRYLRLKLEEDNSKRLIYTVRSVGYVLRESSFS